MSEYVFVYGSLRQGGTNHDKINKFTKIGNGITVNKYSFIGMTSGAYPYASHHSFDGVDKVHIVGELYHVLYSSFFDELDKLEFNYLREITVVIVDGNKYYANIYFLVDEKIINGVSENLFPNGKRRFYNISSGDWLCR
jgi:gamma-glutamylcyclotransferase (GGCT)/AIG2-like uncharacterized protein YtfP